MFLIFITLNFSVSPLKQIYLTINFLEDIKINFKNQHNFFLIILFLHQRYLITFRINQNPKVTYESCEKFIDVGFLQK